MQINLTIDTANDGPRESALLSAIAALLGGTAVAAVPTPPAPVEQPHPLATSEALIKQEARRAAGELTGGSNGGAVSPPVDSSGLPWDARIHSQSSDGSYPTTANGTWRRKRGADDATVAQVEAELRGASAQEAPADTVVPPPPATPTDVPPPPPVEQPSETPPPPPAATVADTSAATSAGSGPSRFANFAELTKAMQEKAPGVTYDQLTAHGALFQLAKWIDARNRPEIWDDFYDTFEA